MSKKVNLIRGEQIEIRVGSKVEFEIGEETVSDTITYILGHVIEGEKFDLTHTRFRVVKY